MILLTCVILAAILLLVLGFLAPRFSRKPQGKLDRSLDKADEKARKAPAPPRRSPTPPPRRAGRRGTSPRSRAGRAGFEGQLRVGPQPPEEPAVVASVGCGN
jgi:hypothetical protein